MRAESRGVWHPLRTFSRTVTFSCAEGIAVAFIARRLAFTRFCQPGILILPRIECPLPFGLVFETR